MQATEDRDVLKAFEAVVARLGGLTVEQACTVATNVLAHILITKARTRAEAIAWAACLAVDVRDNVETNWPPASTAAKPADAAATPTLPRNEHAPARNRFVDTLLDLLVRPAGKRDQGSLRNRA
jgi:hypothetical protein